MKMDDIRKVANKISININRMKKAEAIRAIQKAENNIDCYGTQRVKVCQEHICLWRADCLKD